MDDLLTRYNKLLRQYEVLHKENEVLKSLLKIHGIEYETRMKEDMNKPIYSLVSVPTITLSIDERIRLFQSLFKGREDVFARRWFSKTTGKSGYQPVCINEWKQGICDKKKYRCAICPNRNFAPLKTQDMYRHLEGKDEYCCDVVGLYAIMQDNNCAFLCADFDDKNCKYGYKEDVLAYVGVCREWLIPYAIERSRSGNGAHVWIFFEAPLPASKARRLGNAILTEAMTHNGQMSFNSYDRFFPNQDYLPEGGFGNLVALPLQGQARRKENSVFVDNDFLVYKDQWAFLYNLKKIQESTIDQLLRLHSQEELGKLSMSSESKPWVTPLPQNITQEDFHAKVEIIKANKLYIPLKAVSAKVLNHLKRIAAFKNPEFYNKQALRLSTYAIPRIISCFDITNEYLAMPRGCEDATRSFLNDNAVTYTITDKTNHGNKISVSFYNAISRNTPKLWGTFYNNANKDNSITDIVLRQTLRWYRIRLYRIIKQVDPDQIICTHPFPAIMCAHIARKGKIQVPISNILTDFEPHGLWYVLPEYLKYFFVPTEEMKKALMEKNIKERKMM